MATIQRTTELDQARFLIDYLRGRDFSINFYIPAPLRERLVAEREHTGLSEAEIVRRALDDHLEVREERRRKSTDACAEKPVT